jgi:hypothetical protein
MDWDAAPYRLGVEQRNAWMVPQVEHPLTLSLKINERHAGLWLTSINPSSADRLIRQHTRRYCQISDGTVG